MVIEPAPEHGPPNTDTDATISKGLQFVDVTVTRVPAPAGDTLTVHVPRLQRTCTDTTPPHPAAVPNQSFVVGRYTSAADTPARTPPPVA